MPSSITHQLIAEAAREKFPEEGKRAAERCPDEFVLGAQGPDVFFFYRIGSRSEYNLGKYLHRFRVYETFSFFIEALRGGLRLGEEEYPHALAYVLGYITHYCTDSAFHPFVYRYLEENHCEKREHQQMENDWDVYFLRELRGESAEKFSFGFSADKIVKDGTVARLYAYLAEKLGREDVPKSKFDRAVKNFDLYLGFFHGKCYSAQRGWQRAEKLFGAKRYLSRLFPRENPDPAYLSGEHFLTLSEGRGTNADELFSYAVEESARLTGIFLETLETDAPLPKEEFGNGLLTGKPTDLPA